MMSFDPVSYAMGAKSGGGGSSWTLIGTGEFEVNTTSTNVAQLGYVSLAVDTISPEDIIWVHVRDKAGKRDGYFYGHDAFFLGFKIKNGTAGGSDVTGRNTIIAKSDGAYDAAAGQYGAYPLRIDYDTKKLVIVSRYSNTYSLTVNGTYKVDVYKLAPPFTMFE